MTRIVRAWSSRLHRARPSTTDPSKARNWFIRPITTALVATVVTATALFSAAPVSTHTASGKSAADIEAVTPRLSAAEQAQWQRQVATPAGRAQVLDGVQSAFAGIATVGTGATPASPSPSTTGADGVRNVAYTASGQNVRPAWSAGLAGDHFWIIASYFDIASGAITGAVIACKTRVVGWLCDAAGALLREWARGWGAAHNHGVWAEVYWWPPRVAAGRW